MKKFVPFIVMAIVLITFSLNIILMFTAASQLAVANPFNAIFYVLSAIWSLGLIMVIMISLKLYFEGLKYLYELKGSKNERTYPGCGIDKNKKDDA